MQLADAERLVGRGAARPQRRKPLRVVICAPSDIRVVFCCTRTVGGVSGLCTSSRSLHGMMAHHPDRWRSTVEGSVAVRRVCKMTREQPVCQSCLAGPRCS